MANPLRLNKAAQESLVSYVNSCADVTKRFTDLRTKMELIDIAYARYKGRLSAQDGVDSLPDDTSCGANDQEVTVPIVVSEVDSFVGYLADVYLSGYPIFPVVSTPALKSQAEKLESIIDHDAIISAYPRQLLSCFRAGIKYNLLGLEHDWAPLTQFSSTVELERPTKKPKITQSQKYINRLNCIDPYNLFWDDTVAPANVSYCGEFGGFVEMISRIEFKRRLLSYETDGGYNLATAMSDTSAVVPIGTGLNYYYEQPQISNYLSAPSVRNAGIDWVRWLHSAKQKNPRLNYSNLYELVTIYARIIPQEHGIQAPQDGTPQIWKLVVVNGKKLIYARRIITAYDFLPLHIGQPIEDGFGIQTQSIAELVTDYQAAATTLFSVRFNAARRAVADRALYDPQAINPDDINNPAPASKIPIKQNALLGGKTIDMIYKQIPFDPRGTELAIQDVSTVMEFADRAVGQNRTNRGEFQKGNKNVMEVERTMSGSDNRLRLPALTIEFQTLMPLKENLKLNVIQNSQLGVYQNMRTGQPYDITPQDFDKIREANFKFQVADGYTPKSKLASTEFLSTGMTLIGNSPMLQQYWGPALPAMFAHLMQLGGVKGLEEYLPEVETSQGVPGAEPNIEQQ